MDECGGVRKVLSFVFLTIACSAVTVGANPYTTPYCDGFLTLSHEAPSLLVRAPSVPLGFGRAVRAGVVDDCVWYFHAPVDAVIKLEIVELELDRNDSVRVFDGLGEKFGSGKNFRSALDQDFISTRNTITIQLKSGKFFKGSAVFHLSLQTRQSTNSNNRHGVLSADPGECGGTITLDNSTRIQRFNATNQDSGAYPAYCTWHVVAPPSTVVSLRFVDAMLEYYDNFLVAEAGGARLADFYNIQSAPHNVLSDSNEILCLFAAYQLQSASFVQVEITFIDVASSPLFDENTLYQLSGGHIDLSDSTPSVTFQSTNFSGALNAYVGSYWYVTSPVGSKIKVDFLDVDTGSGVFLDVRSGYNAPVTSVSGRLSLDPVVSLDNFAIVWLSSQWQYPGAGVTIKVSVDDEATLDSATTLSSCGGSIDLNRTSSSFLTFSTPSYGNNVDQYTLCYWYFTSPPNTRVSLDFNDIQTENGYVYVFDSVNVPAITVLSTAGDVSLTPFHSSAGGVTVLYNDLSDSKNGRGLLAKATIIDNNTPYPVTSCGGRISLDASSSVQAIRSPWYDAPISVMAYTTCYWYITCSDDSVVSFNVLDFQTADASLEVFDSATTSPQQRVALIKGQTAPSTYVSSGPGLVMQFSDSPSTTAERGFSGSVSLSDPYSWNANTTLTSCGASIAMDASSLPLVFTSPSYTGVQPDGIFDCWWYFSGPENMEFVLEFLDIDVDQSASLTTYDGLTASSDAQIAQLSGNGVSTTAVTAGSSLILRFNDPSTTDVSPGFRAKVTVTGPPTWDDTLVLDSCGGGIPLNFASRTFMFTTPDYPATNGGYFDCRWYVQSPSGTVVSLEFIDVQTADSGSFLSVRDGTSMYDLELIRLSGSLSSMPPPVNATANNMVLQFFSNSEASGRGASLLITFLGGELPNSDIRLVGGSGPNEGRVELYYDHIWGTVCDDDWGEEDAMVVCRMLGYRTVISVWPRAHFGAGSGQIWLDDLQCSGNEKHITDCPHNMPTGNTNCGHTEDAGVTCGEGADVICDGNSMTVFIDRVLLAHGDGAIDVHLLDKSCHAYDHDSVRVAVSTSFDDCGTVMEETDEVITFSNLITYFQPKSLNGEKITREFTLCVPVTCSFNRHALVGNTYRPQVGVVSFSEIGYQNFSLELGMYQDSTFGQGNRMPEGTEVMLEEPVYFGINLTAVTDLTLMAESCWATPHPYPFDHIKFRIIDNGCPLDPSVRFYDDIIDDPLITTFSVDAFAFVGEYDEVYMHCEVLVCDNTDPNSRCKQGCSHRARRAAATGDLADGGRRGASSRPHTISNGPISPKRSRARNVGSGPDSKYGDDNMSKMVAMGISGILLAAGVMVGYVTFARGRRSKERRQASDSRCEEKAELLDSDNDANII